MPITVNGIGSRYVGRKNLVVRPGGCGSCGRAVQLASYDTREWFVVAFVPLVPLTRYRVLDDCPKCKRHRRLRAKVWEASQAEARLSAQALLRQRPGDPRAAIDAHRKLLAFQLTQDAAELEAAMARQFGGQPDVLVHLGQVAEESGRGADSQRSFELAHQADPANPAAREGLALVALRAGDPDRALTLLGPVLEAKTLQGAAAGCALSSALVAARRFDEARRVQQALLERFPALGESKAFAKEVARSEKALGAQRSSLPALRRARRVWIASAAALLLALGGLLAADFTAAAHVTLYVVSSAPGRLRVEIPGAEALEFRQAGVRVVELPAGEHRASVHGAVERQLSFRLRRQGWPRFLDDSVHVLDATGDSILCVEQATYSVRPGRGGQPQRLLYGEDFRCLEHIDFPFQPFPQSIALSNGGRPEQRTRLGLAEGSLEGLVYEHLAQNDVGTAVGLSTWNLKRDPQSDEGLACYVAAARAAHAEQQAALFLAPRLEARPVRWAAQRAWLELCAGQPERARARFRELREREPREPAWPYFLAQLSTRIPERLELLEAAHGDEAPAEVSRLLAETQASNGEWGPALESAQAALEPEAADWDALFVRLDALVALGRTSDCEQDLHAFFERSPGNFALALRWFERRPAAVPEAQIVKELADWQQQAARAGSPVDPRWVAWLRAWTAFARGDLGTLERLDKAAADRSLTWMHAGALADLGKLDELRPYGAGQPRFEIEPWDALAIALACRAGGDATQAGAWEARALPQLVDGADLEAAALLRGERKGVATQALELALAPWRKSVLLALLSFSDEGERVHLLHEALRLQARPIFPRRQIESLAAQAVPR